MFSMNSSYLFIWSEKNINYFDLSKPFLIGPHGYQNELDVKISWNDSSHFESVTVGNNDNKVAISI